MAEKYKKKTINFMAAKKRFQSLFISFQAHAHVRLLVFFFFLRSRHVTNCFLLSFGI